MLGLHCCARASHCSGFCSWGAHRLSSRGSQALEHRLGSFIARTSLAVLQHVGSSWSRDQAHYVPCIGRWIFNHETIREVLIKSF